MTLTPRSQHVYSPHVPSKTLKGSHGCCDDASAMVKPAKDMDSPRPAVCGMPVEWPSGESLVIWCKLRCADGTEERALSLRWDDVSYGEARDEVELGVRSATHVAEGTEERVLTL